MVWLLKNCNFTELQYEMTVITKNKKTQSSPVESTIADMNIDRKRQIRLGTGIFLMFSGIFICVSIISYYLSWKIDQDNFLSSVNLFQFLFKDKTPVANWGGHLGAAISHILVYKGAGVASLSVGIMIASLGINLTYEKKPLPILPYLRWLSITLLILAPILSYLFPNTACPLGGALGDIAIGYLINLLGSAGTGMVLLSLVVFFLFVIIALDLRPLISKIRVRIKNMMESYSSSPKFNEPETDTEQDTTEEPKIAEPEKENDEKKVTEAINPNSVIATKLNKNQLLKKEEDIPLIIEDTRQSKEWDMAIVEKATITPIPQPPVANIPAQAPTTPPSKPIMEDEMDENTDNFDEEDFDEMLDDDFIDDEEEEELPPIKGKTKDKKTPEFSFEVIQQEEKPAIKHGSHIAIGSNEPYAPELDLPDYQFPTLNLLLERTLETISLDKDELEKNKNQIIQTLRSFSIEIQKISATVGPTVTLYEIVPAEGVRIAKIKNLEDDIALNLSALGIRIIAPIPGKGTIGIEVPNANKQIVSMRTLIASDKFVNSKMSLPIALGKKIDNENYIVDLATMPHLLMAGATGQGKSVGINAILVSLLYKKHPSQLKFVMIDPKKVELSIYRTIEKHFLAKLPDEEEPIITDVKKVINTLNSMCIEMDNRYELLKEAGARNIKEYNEKFISRRLNPERGHKYLPFIVLVIDEFADLIMTAGKEVEIPIARIAQLARAVGIHLIIATQRPSVNVITGIIKANFPARIAFKVSAKVDSRTILDASGAEQLIGRGDLLLSFGSELLRIQCAFVDTPEVENIVEFIGKQRGYPMVFELPEYEGADDGKDGKEKDIDLTNRDKLFEDCSRVVVQTQSGSTSMLQRRFNLGYNRAGRIMDQLESVGIVGPASGSKPREVYFKTEAELEQFLHSLD